MFADAIVTVVIASACFLAIWYLKGAVITPVGGDDITIEICLHASGEAQGLEHTVSGLLWLMENDTLTGEILICDEGMAQEACALARILERQDDRVHYMENLENYGSGKRAD